MRIREILTIAGCLITVGGCGFLGNDLFLPRKELTVSASVHNQSAKTLTVIFSNHGPHDGGCDGKNNVTFVVPPSSQTVKHETWRCKTDQIFSITVVNPDGEILVRENQSTNVAIRCDDVTCTIAPLDR